MEARTCVNAKIIMNKNEFISSYCENFFLSTQWTFFSLVSIYRYDQKLIQFNRNSLNPAKPYVDWDFNCKIALLWGFQKRKKVCEFYIVPLWYSRCKELHILHIFWGAFNNYVEVSRWSVESPCLVMWSVCIM